MMFGRMLWGGSVYFLGIGVLKEFYSGCLKLLFNCAGTLCKRLHLVLLCDVINPQYLTNYFITNILYKMLLIVD